MIKKQEWQTPSEETEYYCVPATRGREFIVRMTTGADPVKSLKKFAEDNNIRFGKVHAAFMGGFQPCCYDLWAPDMRDMSNQNNEVTATHTQLTMLCAMGGMIGIRPGPDGKEESFVAAHVVAGGGWDSSTIAGHLEEGTKVFGIMQVFVTEILDIDVLYPYETLTSDVFNKYPENWYKSTK